MPRGAGQFHSSSAALFLTRALAVEWGKHRINVNCIGPGAIDTDMNARSFSRPEVVERVTNSIPWGRIGKPEDIAPVAVFLSSPDSDYITGQTINVDGGLIMS